jgi:uncharacterized membrane protein YsdA (DUF1294 family)
MTIQTKQFIYWLIPTILLTLVAFYYLNNFWLSLLIATNITTFFLYGIDKLQAQAKRRRIAENTLHLTAFLGGSVGALFAMYFFRHKTNKLSFKILLGFLILVQMLIIWFTIDPAYFFQLFQ